MKVLVYSDLQATEGHERCFHDPTTPLQQWRVSLFYDQLHELYKKHHCEAVWDLGDTTDDRSAIPVPTLDIVLQGVERFQPSEKNIKLVGNHEQYIKNGSIHTGKLFNSRFSVVVDREMIDFGSFTLVAASYPSNEADLAQWLKEKGTALRRSRKRSILIGHFQTSGCVMNSGISLTGISKQVLELFDLGLLGHVHRGQALTPTVHYVGSPFQQDFGESQEDKHVAVLDTDALTIDWISMTGFPEYRTTSLQDFINSVTAESENRYKVCLSSPSETELFFAHPLSSRAEPIAQYDLPHDPVSPSSTEKVQGPSTPRMILERYVSAFPPSQFNVVINDRDMVDFGLEIANMRD